MIKTAQHKLFKLAENFAQKLLSFGKAISLDDATKCLLAPLEGETFIYSGEDPFGFIRYVYKTKSKKMHPDANRDDPDANAKQTALNTAFDALKGSDRNILEGLLIKYSSEPFSTDSSQEYSAPQRPEPRSRGRGSLFDPLSDEEMESLESVMRGRRSRTPETPTASETAETSKPKPRRSGLFGGLSKEQLSKIKY